MTLYIKADHLDRAAQDFQSINTLIDFIAEKIINDDLTEPEERERIVKAMIAISDIAEDAHARTASALASACMEPHDFTDESFKA